MTANHLTATSVPSAQFAEAGVPFRERGLLRRFGGSLLHNYVALAALAFLLVVAVAAVAAPAVAPADPVHQDLLQRLQPPSWSSTAAMNGLGGGRTRHLLGTDELGRDVLSRLIYGARVSLALGLFCSASGAIIGVSLGLLAALHGGWLEVVIMRLVDAQLAFPFIVLAIAVVAVTGPSLINLYLLLSVFGWAPFARLVRGDALAVKQREFVTAARAIGANEWRIAVRHILPNVISPIIVVATFTVAEIVIVESSLSFLGVGVQPPTPYWGGMLSSGQNYLDSAWWLATFSGFAIMATVLAFNILGNFLRQFIDPNGQR